MNIKSIVHKHLINEVRVKSSERIKLYEDDEWLVVHPLSFKASCKYGHGSSWCTSTPSNDENFVNYKENGVLIYYINKNTDDKYAEFINIYTHKWFFNKQDEPIEDLPDFLKNIQNQIKTEVSNLLVKKKNEYLNKLKETPSLEWLNQLWSKMDVFKWDEYPNITSYGVSVDDLYFEIDSDTKYFWMDVKKIWSKISNENKWTSQQTLDFFKYWLDQHLNLGYLKLKKWF